MFDMCSPGELTERLEVGLSWQQAGGRSCLVVRLRDARERVPSPMNERAGLYMCGEHGGGSEGWGSFEKNPKKGK